MKNPDDLTSYLAALVGDLTADPTEGATVRAVLNGARSVVPEAEHVGLVGPVPRRGVQPLGSSSTIAARCDAWQAELTPAPCHDAAEGWVRSAHLPTEARWPAWTAKAAAEGVRSVLVVPMLAGGDRLGCLNLYGLRSGGFDGDDVVKRALVFGLHAGAALRQARMMAGMRAAIATRHEIGLAQGILMERFGMDVDATFAVLKRYSSTMNIPLRIIAAHVARTRELPDVAPGGSGQPRPASDSDATSKGARR